VGTAGGTRRVAGGVLSVVARAGGSPMAARAWQRSDGVIEARIRSPEPEAAHERLRFMLALDADHAPFLRQARRDPLLREAAWRHAGLRPMRLGTVAHALVKAVVGQLVSGSEAMRLHRAVVGRCAPSLDGLRLPPTAFEVAAMAPAEAVGLGLAGRRAATLSRAARTLDLDRLAAEPPARVAARIQRERGLGPWSTGVIGLYGLGRYEHGLVGDLGLMRLWAAERGAWPAPEETAELLEPYGEWAGLASLYLLRHPLAARHGPGAWRDRRTERVRASGRTPADRLGPAGHGRAGGTA